MSWVCFARDLSVFIVPEDLIQCPSGPLTQAHPVGTKSTRVRSGQEAPTTGMGGDFKSASPACPRTWFAPSNTHTHTHTHTQAHTHTSVFVKLGTMAYGCVFTNFIIAVAQTLNRRVLERKCSLGRHGFSGLSPLVADSIALGTSRGSPSWGKGPGEESFSPQSSKEAEAERGEGRGHDPSESRPKVTGHVPPA